MNSASSVDRDVPLHERVIPLTRRASCDALTTSSFDRAQQQTNVKKSYLTKQMITLALSCALGFATLGYQLTVLNAPGPIVIKWINVSYTRRESAVSASTVRTVYAWATGALAGGAIIGALTAGPVAERFGRRTCQLIIAFIALFANGIMCISGYVFSPELLIVGRVIVGVSIGATTVVSPMYVVEASPREIRGSIGVVNQFGSVIFLFIAEVLGLPIVLGTAARWPMLFFVAAALPAAQILLTLMSFESPRFLYISRGAHTESIYALQMLRVQGSSIGEEIREYQEEESQKLSETSAKKVTVFQLFRHKEFLWPLSVVIVLHLSMMWSGINGIVGYSIILFREAGLSRYEATFANLAVGAIFIVMACVTIVLIERLGRRLLHLVGLAGMITFGYIQKTFIYFTAVESIDLRATASKFVSRHTYRIIVTIVSVFTPHLDSTSSTFTIIIIVCELCYLAFYAIGPSSLPWIVTNELFSQEARGPASSVGSLVNWISQLITFVGFPWLQSVLGDWVFLPFAMFLSLFFIFLYKYMPETKGRTFEQISEFFSNDKLKKRQSKSDDNDEVELK